MLFLFLNLLLDAEFNPLHTPLVNGDEKLRLNTLPNSLLIGYCHFILQNKYHVQSLQATASPSWLSAELLPFTSPSGRETVGSFSS